MPRGLKGQKRPADVISTAEVKPPGTAAKAKAGARVAAPKTTMERAEQLAGTGEYAFLYQVEQALRAAGFELGGGRATTLQPEERARIRAFLKDAKKH